MLITLQTKDGTRTAREPFRGADCVIVAGTCPDCGAEPFKVAGTGEGIESGDTYRADAVCLGCKARVGTLRVKVSTLVWHRGRRARFGWAVEGLLTARVYAAASGGR